MVINAHHEEERQKADNICGLFKNEARYQSKVTYDEPIELLNSFTGSRPFDWTLRSKIKSQLRLEGLDADIFSSNYSELHKWLDKKYFSHGLFQARYRENLSVNYTIVELISDSVAIQLTPVDNIPKTQLSELYENDEIKFYQEDIEMSYHELISYYGNLEKISVKTINPISCEERSLNFLLQDD